MGMFEVDVRVSNPAGGDYYKASMLVDTGATHSKLPASLLREIGVEPDQTEAFSFPDTEWKEYPVGEARFEIGGRKRTAPVIFGEEGSYILGATALQALGFIPDTTDHQLVPAQHFLVGIRGKPFLG